MIKATLEMVQNRLPDFVDSSAKQPILIVRDGKPVAMLVGLGAGEKRIPVQLRDILQQAWQEYEEQGGIPHDQFWEQMAEEVSPRKKKRPSGK